MWEIIPPGLTLAFVTTTFLGRRYSSFGLRLLYLISAVWLGILNFSFFAAYASWIVSVTDTLSSFHFEPKIVAETFFGGAMLASIYGLLNASRLRITRISVNLPNLPAAWQRSQCGARDRPASRQCPKCPLRPAASLRGFKVCSPTPSSSVVICLTGRRQIPTS